MRCVITITELPGGSIVMDGSGDFDFNKHKDTLIAKATMAAANAVNAVIKESNEFETPIVSGETAAVEMFEGDKRPSVPAHIPTRRFIDATGI